MTYIVSSGALNSTPADQLSPVQSVCHEQAVTLTDVVVEGGADEARAALSAREASAAC